MQHFQEYMVFLKRILRFVSVDGDVWMMGGRLLLGSLDEGVGICS